MADRDATGNMLSTAEIWAFFPAKKSQIFICLGYTLNTARMYQEGLILSDGRVLIAGGQDRGVTSLNFSSAEIYDPISGTWSNTGSMAIGRRCCFTLTLLPTGQVLVAGGGISWTSRATALAELYDPTTGIWTPTTSLPTTRQGHSATLLPDGTVLVAGGNDHPGDFGSGTNLDTALIYDPTMQTWSLNAGTMGEVRTGHQEAFLLDNRVLVVGGSGSGLLSTAELFSTLALTLVKTDTPDPVAVGGIVTYTLVVTNSGFLMTTGVVLTDTLGASNLATLTILDDDDPINLTYLPLLLRNYTPPITFPAYIGGAISKRPIIYQGEVFYTQTVRMPDELPSGGHFYLSAQPDAVTEVLVDDKLAILLNGTEVFTHQFPVPQPAIVEISRATLEQMVGQTVTIVYQDVYGAFIEASPIWLIWVP